MTYILDSPTDLARNSVIPINEVYSPLRKHTVRAKAAMERASSLAHPLPVSEGGRETTCDVSVGVKRSYTI